MKKNKNKILIATIAVLLLFTLGAAWYFMSQKKENYVRDGINYAPATNEDKVFNDSVKDSITEDGRDQPAEAKDTEARKSVLPTISAWGQPAGFGTDLKINGYVPGIIETNGECTVTLVKGEMTASATKTALQNVQDTSCGQLVIPFSNLSSGTWKATLSYSSASSEGTSKSVDIEVK